MPAAEGLSNQELSTRLEGDIGRLILNRPDFQNAMSKQMWETLPTLLDDLKTAGAKVIVVSSFGSTFCAGADLNDLKTIDCKESAAAQWMPIKNALDHLAAFELPTVAVVQGACLGGGCLLSIACDLRYAAEPAYFGIPVAKLGIVLDDANIFRLISLVGPHHAKELLFTASTISSAHAKAIGLVNGVFSEMELPTYVDEVASKIASNGTASVRESKRAVARFLGSLMADGKQIDLQDKVIESYTSSDFRERIQRALG
ncbi:MAG TPA: enoyl-CoA hydratase/isomerase family protein [Candidatus Obscuribacterales bacterium]